MTQQKNFELKEEKLCKTVPICLKISIVDMLFVGLYLNTLFSFKQLFDFFRKDFLIVNYTFLITQKNDFVEDSRITTYSSISRKNKKNFLSGRRVKCCCSLFIVKLQKKKTKLQKKLKHSFQF
ncbi:hypothetical protein RFI_31589 [Reticulomyxa filosa]|uniref:Transmembrane protein n=1 Tax=Reticulomyxa filosa TaxID=46433 RepID=X6LXE1_RETFI|nr:hypothetical protein RFI_31589 [Reticulomyxa filosa]|eukprot:ETO05807.1 hypothetical protein RFI_31589 [Reticulomyxa filosa]